MIPSALRRRLAALALPLAVLAGVTSGEQLLLCAMDGYTRSCCCPHEQRAASEVAFERTSCCTGVDASVAPTPTGEQRQTQTLARHQAAQLAVHVSCATAVDHQTVLAIVAPPCAAGPRTTTGPPMFIRHRALLI